MLCGTGATTGRASWTPRRSRFVATTSCTPPETILAQTNLGKRHDRLAPTLATALRAGLARDPQTLPRRPRGERRTISAEEIALQDRIRAVRDRAATQLSIDPTLIASRAQLVELARTPAQIDAILLPWQAALLREDPALAPAEKN
jgi:ribonuclease D